MTVIAPNLRWTWRTILATVLAAWIVLLVAFPQNRTCSPLNAECREKFRNLISDFVWLEFLSEWQTLVAGLIAIVAAMIGGFYINKQIHVTERLEQDRQAREFEAVRAMLPIHLSALIAHLVKCGGSLRSIYKMNSIATPYRLTNPYRFPPLPMDTATFLQTVILRAPPIVRPPIVSILSNLQVFHARLEDLEPRLKSIEANSVTYIELDAYIIQAVDLHAWCLALLPFARNQSEEVPTLPWARGQYLTCLNIMGFEHEEFASLYQKAAHLVAGLKDDWANGGFDPATN